MSIELERRIDEFDERLRVFELELHGLRRLVAAEAIARTAAPEPPVSQPSQERPAPVPPPRPAAAARPAAPRPAVRAARPTIPRPAPAPRPTFGDLVERIDLFGPRGLAVAGGIVTLLGIVFFFVLATNRGWIGPGERVALGAAASLLAFLSGVVIRYRFGQLHAAVASVGAGIAGGYATLAAATVLYGLLPPLAALPCAAGIAAAGLAIALLWWSELLAALGLLGAVLSPAALALDDGVTVAGTAFAIVVFGALTAVAVRRTWLGLLAAGVAATLPQVAWTVLAADVGDAGTTAISAVMAALLLATAFAWELTHRGEGLGAVAAGLSALGIGTALGSTVVLYPDGTDQAIVLAAYAVGLGGLCALVARTRVELAYVIGAGALGLAGVATADVLSGASLASVFAAECVVASLIANRLRERRFQLAALVYLGLALLETLRAQSTFVLDEGSASLAVAGLVAGAIASLAVGVLAPAEDRERSRSGVLAVLEPLLGWLGRIRVPLRAGLACLAFGLLALAVDDVLAGLWLTLAYTAAAIVFAVAARRLGELRLVPFALTSASLAAVHALAVDAPVLPSLYPELSAGDAGAAGVAAAGLAVAACALLLPRRQRGIVRLGGPSGIETPLLSLARRRGDVGLALAGVAAALGLAAAGLALGAALGDTGHVVTVVLWCAAGLGAVVAATLRSRWLAAEASALLLVATFVKVVGYDWPELGADQGAAELLVCSAAILLAGWALRALSTSPAPLTAASASAAVVTTIAVPYAIDQLIGSDRVAGVAMLAVAAAYAVLAAVAQRGPRLRNLATAMWIPGLFALLLSEELLLQNRLIVVAYAATAVALAWLGRGIAETRLVKAALVIVGATTVVTVAVLTPPTHLLVAGAAPGSSAWALAACASAVAAIGWVVSAARRRQLGWMAGGLAVYVASLVILELAQRLSGASVQTDFERGHTAVSALWGVIGLALLVAGLLRRTQALRLGGLALFGISLAKLFLYDLSTLSSITRAFSFIAVGALLLAGGFFLQRLGSRLDETSKPHPAT